MKLEIVTHCYQYSRLLRYHLSSLVLSPPEELEITSTICFTASDTNTAKVLRSFENYSVPNVKWNWLSLSALEVCRRAIGRNKAALNSTADWIWFCDVDYWFGPLCWRAVAGMNGSVSPLIFPRYVNTHKTQDLGNQRIAMADEIDGLLAVPMDEFEPVRLNRAIGGIQIALGDICRERGYLKNSSKWQRLPPTPGFRRTFEDVQFRKDLGTKGKGVDIPQVYRIRHSEEGRNNPLLQL